MTNVTVVVDNDPQFVPAQNQRTTGVDPATWDFDGFEREEDFIVQEYHRMSDGIDAADAACATLEDISNKLESYPEVDQATARIVQITIENISKNLGIEVKTPSLESFSGSKPALESISDFLKGIIDAIIRTFKRIVEFFGELFGWKKVEDKRNKDKKTIEKAREVAKEREKAPPKEKQGQAKNEGSADPHHGTNRPVQTGSSSPDPEPGATVIEDYKFTCRELMPFSHLGQNLTLAHLSENVSEIRQHLKFAESYIKSLEKLNDHFVTGLKKLSNDFSSVEVDSLEKETAPSFKDMKEAVERHFKKVRNLDEYSIGSSTTEKKLGIVQIDTPDGLTGFRNGKVILSYFYKEKNLDDLYIYRLKEVNPNEVVRTVTYCDRPQQPEVERYCNEAADLSLEFTALAKRAGKLTENEKIVEELNQLSKGGTNVKKDVVFKVRSISSTYKKTIADILGVLKTIEDTKDAHLALIEFYVRENV